MVFGFLYKNITLILQFFLGITIIVGLHELGHLFFAKLFKMKVESYGIGLPPKLLRYRKGETEYYLGAIPLGGAVVIANQYNEDDPDYKKPVWQRLLVMCGGVFMNLIAAFVIFVGMFIFSNDSQRKIVDSRVEVILENKDHSSINPFKKTKIDCNLNEKNISIKENKKINPIYGGWIFLKKAITVNCEGLWRLISGKISFSKSLSGPIEIARIFSSSFDFFRFFDIVAHISIVLAITNLLPLPALDGGHATLLLYELIFRRRISTKTFFKIQKIGVGMLLFLSVYTTFNDIYKIFFK